jgi:outer membrane protein, heavy metal efflux system
MKTKFIGLFAAGTLVSFLSLSAIADDDELLTAAQLVDAVLAHNRGLDGVESEAHAAAAEVVIAGALDDPMLMLSFAPNTYDTATGGRGGIEFSQRLPWWGTRAAREDSARDDAAAAKQDAEVAMLELAARARAAYADWYFVHRALEINAANQALLADAREVAMARYATGTAVQRDVLQADVERVRLRQQALEFERMHDAVQAGINSLMSRAPDSPVPIPAALPISVGLPPLATLSAQAQAQNPRVRRLDFRQRAADARVAVAEKSRYPEFRLIAAYNGVMDPVEKRLMVGVSMSLPLGQRKREATVDAARADLRGVQHGLADLRSILAGEIMSAHAGVDEARRSLTLYREELLPLAESSVALSRSAYAAGDGDFLDLIVAERELLDAQLRTAKLESLLFQRLAELTRLVGATSPDELESGAANHE